MSQRTVPDNIRRKVMLDIFAAPGTLLPIAGGLTAFMASWAMGGNAPLTFGGIAGILAGVGVLASRLILGLEGITKRAYDYVLEGQRTDQIAALRNLEERLLQDEDPRTEHCLRELWHLYSRMKEKCETGKINPAGYEVIEGVDKMFRVCIEQLEHSLELWETAKPMRGPARETLLQQRDALVREICATVTHLGAQVEQFHLMKTKKNRADLARLRKELDESIEVARRAEARATDFVESGQLDTRETE
jgi:hypothetical protein